MTRVLKGNWPRNVTQAGTGTQRWLPTIAIAAMVGVLVAATTGWLDAEPSTGLRLAGIAILLAMASAGTLALVHVPRLAIPFCIAMCLAAVFLALPLGIAAASALSLFALVHGIAIIRVLGIRREAIQPHQAAPQDLYRQREITDFVLHDSAGNVRAWLWETDATGRITTASRGLVDLLKHPGQELQGQSLVTMFGHRQDGAGWNRLLLAMETVLRASFRTFAWRAIGRS